MIIWNAELLCVACKETCCGHWPASACRTNGCLRSWSLHLRAASSWHRWCHLAENHSLHPDRPDTDSARSCPGSPCWLILQKTAREAKLDLFLYLFFLGKLWKKKKSTSHQYTPSLGPLCPSVWGEETYRWETLFLTLSHLHNLLQLSQQVSFVEATEVDHHIENKELGQDKRQSVAERNNPKGFDTYRNLNISEYLSSWYSFINLLFICLTAHQWEFIIILHLCILHLHSFFNLH